MNTEEQIREQLEALWEDNTSIEVAEIKINKAIQSLIDQAVAENNKRIKEECEQQSDHLYRQDPFSNDEEYTIVKAIRLDYLNDILNPQDS